MSEPLVCAVMLTKERPTMAARSVRCFREQTYKRSSLLIFDTSEKQADEYALGFNDPFILYHHEDARGRTTGTLRNDANGLAMIAKTPKEIDIFVHFDDDDVSHPRRIEEQVALLVASGKECVGYNEMVFWDETSGPLIFDEANASKPGKSWPQDVHRPIGEAWLFQNKSPNYALGTSLCYWRSTWEKHPFPDKMRGEDYDFVYGCDSAGCSSLCAQFDSRVKMTTWQNIDQLEQPRMIASIHAGNGVRIDQRAPHHWKRVPQFDQFCRDRMAP